MNTYGTSTIAEMTNGIILAKFERKERTSETAYQTEAEMEEKLINDLVLQGYTRYVAKDNNDLYANLKERLEELNNVSFSPSEWKRFLIEYLDSPQETMIEKTRKIQSNHIYDFTFDNGIVKNIKLIDKKNINNNKLQVMSQFKQTGIHANRYDVTVLVNGLPLVHIELKKRGVSLHEAFAQINRYGKESFNMSHSLYKYVQIFVISNGTYTRYFANTTAKDKSNYEFTCEWADAKNDVIRDIEDFTATFFDKRTLLEVLTKYCVFDSNDILLIMRPYQIAATERILWTIESGYNNKNWGKREAGGYVWHTTGSGKTLTSFKTAKLATSLEYIDKVFFVVDRKDLDYQTMKEYQKFQPDSVNGSKDTKELKKSIEKEDSRIVVTTIQKLNEFVKKNSSHPIFDKHCVFIYDECHRSQFGEAQKNIKKSFKKYYQFGFTGTPIFVENSFTGDTTESTFGRQLHSYVITDAIRDGKVLKFKVDYNNVSMKFKSAEQSEENENDVDKQIKNKFLNVPERIEAITKHILDVFDTKTHRNQYYSIKNRSLNGFNAMLAVENIEAAKMYYEAFKKLQSHLPEENRLKIGTIFSYAANETSAGDIDENPENTTNLDATSKEFLSGVIQDYNTMFKSMYSLDGNSFQEYYRDISLKVKNKEIDLLIVVGMFLTGFDAPTLNTLFVDKNLRYHGLIQAYSRTNRILNELKPFGNIVCFRDLEKATKNAIATFGNKNTLNVIMEKSYESYLDGYVDENTNEYVPGLKDVAKELIEKFPESKELVLMKDKEEFVKLFGKYLKLENILSNFDEFSKFENPITPRKKQDMKSMYIEIREEARAKRLAAGTSKEPIEEGNFEFHIDLLKTDEINLEYILAIVLELSRTGNEISKVIDEIKRTSRSSLETRDKESILISFVNSVDISKIDKTEDIIDVFYTYAKKEKDERIMDFVREENLKGYGYEFVKKCIKKGGTEWVGTELDDILPPLSRRGGGREAKKQELLNKINELIAVFSGV